MGTVNWDNLAEHAQQLLQRIDPDLLDLEPLADLENAAAGMLPPQVVERLLDEACGYTQPSNQNPRKTHLSTQPLRPAANHSPLVSAEVSDQVARGSADWPAESNGDTTALPLHHSENTTPDHRNTSKKCAAQNKRTGDPCKAWATASDYCVFHDPELEDAVNEMRAKGGRTPRRVLVGDARKLDFQTMDRGAIQALISHVVRLQLLGAMSPRQASTTVKLIGLLVSNARELESNQENVATFKKTTRNLVEFTDKLVAHLDERELSERLNAIEDAGSKREQILKTNERYAPPPPTGPSKTTPTSTVPSRARKEAATHSL